MAWTPAPFNLLRDGNPFEYSEHTISSISATEAFDTGIRNRDKRGCVVCGEAVRCATHLAHIIPRVDEETWQMMKDNGFVPVSARSVEHETRNGILLCPNHHSMFDGFRYYIRWIPEENKFVLINHSHVASLEIYHGRAIDLHVGDNRLPFHGAFLFHEMRVRGFWPLYPDRPISTPIPWADWIIALDQGGDGGGGAGGAGGGGGEGSGIHGRGRGRGRGSNSNGNGHRLRSGGPIPGPSQGLFTPTNPFGDPATLQALKDSFAQQPNWKAAIIEGTSWEGNADENAAKWRRLNQIDQ